MERDGRSIKAPARDSTVGQGNRWGNSHGQPCSVRWLYFFYALHIPAGPGLARPSRAASNRRRKTRGFAAADPSRSLLEQG